MKFVRIMGVLSVLVFVSCLGLDDNPPAITAPIQGQGVPEVGDALCVDQQDNDLDGLVDCADSDCASVAACQGVVVPPPPVSTAPYAFGAVPTTANPALANALYDAWIADYYEESPDGTMARIRWDTPEYTVSEGIGYGMLASLYAYGTGDPTRFNKLFAYHKTFRNAFGLMFWKVSGFSGASAESGSEGAATDADLDVALALLLAYERWGGENYLAEAKELMAKIRGKLLSTSLTGYMLKPGSAFEFPYNPSYISIVALRYFSIYDTDIPSYLSWNTVLENNLNMVIGSQNAVTGLFPDWCDENGTPSKPQYSAALTYNKFYLEAIRVPWRMTWDYLWFGDQRMYNMMNLISTWAENYHQFNPENINENYALDASVVSDVPYPSKPGYVGAFATAAMVDPAHQVWLDATYNKLTSMVIDPSSVISAVKQNGGYYHRTLQVMEAQMLSGMWVKPGT